MVQFIPTLSSLLSLFISSTNQIALAPSSSIPTPSAPSKGRFKCAGCNSTLQIYLHIYHSRRMRINVNGGLDKSENRLDSSRKYIYCTLNWLILITIYVLMSRVEGKGRKRLFIIGNLVRTTFPI